jgi:hypothetical protein
MFSIKSLFNRNNVINSSQVPHLALNLFVAISTFVCSFLVIFVLIKYVILTTHAIEHLDTVFELGVIRPIPNSTITNSLVEVVSINSTVANSIVEVGSISSTMAVESATNNVTTNTATLLIDSTTNHNYPQSVESHQNVNNNTPLHRRIIIVYFVGAIVFLGINAVVDTYVFVSTS